MWQQIRVSRLMKPWNTETHCNVLLLFLGWFISKYQMFLFFKTFSEQFLTRNTDLMCLSINKSLAPDEPGRPPHPVLCWLAFVFLYLPQKRGCMKWKCHWLFKCCSWCYFSSSDVEVFVSSTFSLPRMSPDPLSANESEDDDCPSQWFLTKGVFPQFESP